MRPIAVRVGKDFSLIPACCIHWPLTDKELLEEWVSKVKSTPNAYTLLMGDSFDFARSHYRNHIRSYRDDDNSQEAIDEWVRRDVAELAKILEPVKDRIWGVIVGNHAHEFLDGTNSEQALCQILGLRYLGPMGLIRVACNLSNVNKSKVRNLTVFAHHSGGSSGGRTTGGSVNALGRQEGTWDADIYLMGHDHRRIGWKETVLELSQRGEPVKILSRDRVFARCGAFLRGFRYDNPSPTQRHTPSYAETKALRPTDLGWIQIDVRWRDIGPRTGNREPRPEYTLRY